VRCSCPYISPRASRAAESRWAAPQRLLGGVGRGGGGAPSCVFWEHTWPSGSEDAKPATLIACRLRRRLKPTATCAACHHWVDALSSRPLRSSPPATRPPCSVRRHLLRIVSCSSRTHVKPSQRERHARVLHTLSHAHPCPAPKRSDGSHARPACSNAMPYSTETNSRCQQIYMHSRPQQRATPMRTVHPCPTTRAHRHACPSACTRAATSHTMPPRPRREVRRLVRKLGEHDRPAEQKQALAAILVLSRADDNRAALAAGAIQPGTAAWAYLSS
jgi:hypothetical protein